ncbi:MAG TPA: MgtC/SapB family protein [Gaiellaceae bacterium]|jgi:putative Mg2+ transporter-C (MgtC) family protein|nr:MgtC/SapB family protein [Gaiellaceae bacterium]
MGPELGLDEAVLRLLLVLVLAGAVGVERELRDQDAGLRTHMLVGVGAALFVMAGNYAWSELAFGSESGIVLDPSRVVAYVVTGVGFLGAGAILKGNGSVRGLTTAASLWVVAAVGVVVGAGEYALGVTATLILLLSLWPVRKLAALLGLRSSRTRELSLEVEPGTRLADVLGVVESFDLELKSTRISDEGQSRRVLLTVAGRESVLTTAVDGLIRSPHVLGVTLT